MSMPMGEPQTMEEFRRLSTIIAVEQLQHMAHDLPRCQHCGAVLEDAALPLCEACFENACEAAQSGMTVEEQMLACI